MDVNEPLIELAMLMRRRRCTCAGIWWHRRELLHDEDSRSRAADSIESFTVTQDWFDEWMATLPTAEQPNVDAFADTGNAKLPFYAALEPIEGQFYDGLSTVWARRHILWAFPPLGVAGRALQNWRASESQLAYFCLPDLTSRGSERPPLIRRFTASGEIITRVPPVHISRPPAPVQF
jgi:hypothetical protein